MCRKKVGNFCIIALGSFDVVAEECIEGCSLGKMDGASNS
jgi:hypothetical protein